MSGSVSRYQALPTTTPTTQVALLNSSTSGNVGVGVSYSLSPRTQIGAEVSRSRSISRIMDMYSTAATVSVGRIMSRRWFAQFRAGAGIVTPVRRFAQIYQGPQFVGGGALGFKTNRHTIMASYDRVRSDPYGLGAESTSSVSAAWSWRSRGDWSASAGGGHLQTSGSRFGQTDSWRARATLSKELTRQLGAAFEFLRPHERRRFRQPIERKAGLRRSANVLLVARRRKASNSGPTGEDQPMNATLSRSPLGKRAALAVACPMFRFIIRNTPAGASGAAWRIARQHLAWHNQPPRVTRTQQGVRMKVRLNDGAGGQYRFLWRT